MLKGYRVQLLKKDNRNGSIEKFVFEKESHFSNCKECYLDASEVLLDGLSHVTTTHWTTFGGVLLGDYALEKERVPKIKELVHTSEYYTYIVTIVCKN